MEDAATCLDPRLRPIPSELLLDMLKVLMAYNPRDVASSAMLVSKEWRRAAMRPELWEHVEVTLTDESHSLPGYAQKVTLPHADAVKAFSQSFQRLDNAGLQALQLRELTLTGNAHPSASDLHALRKAPNLTKLVCNRSLEERNLPDITVVGSAETCMKALSSCHELRHLQADVFIGTLGRGSSHHLAKLTGLRVLNMWQDICLYGLSNIVALTGLQELYMHGLPLGLEGENISALRPLRNLRVLDVQFARLVHERYLLEVVTTFTQLQSLSLERFEFTNKGLRLVASLTQLQTLALQRNIFSKSRGVPAELSTMLEAISVLARQCTNLKVLTFMHSPLPVGAVAAFETLVNLESLDVTGTDRLGAADAMVLAGLTKLTKLHLTGSALGITALHALNSLSNLRELMMQRGGADDCPNLREYELDGERNNRRHYGIMLQLTGLSKLEQLELDWNPAIETAQIQRLSALNSCPMTCSGDVASSGTTVDTDSSTLGTRLLAHFSKVATLRIAEIGACGEPVSLLSALVNLTDLDLTRGRIHAQARLDASHLRTLSALNKLTCLQLRRHNLGPKATPEIAKIGSLHKVGLGQCGVGGMDGSAPELHMLSSLVGLKDLDLSGNELRNAACPKLARLTGLVMLDIANNCIDYYGCRQLTALSGLRFMKTDREALAQDGKDRGAELFPVLVRRGTLG